MRTRGSWARRLPRRRQAPRSSRCRTPATTAPRRRAAPASCATPARSGPTISPATPTATCSRSSSRSAGRRVVTDSGVHGYEGDPLRDWCRSTRAHNTVEIDGQSQCEFWSVFRVGRRARPRDVRFEPRADGFRLSAWHDGYQRLPGAPRHQRRFLWHPRGVLLVRDEIASGRPVTARSRLHLHPDCVVEESSRARRAGPTPGRRLPGRSSRGPASSRSSPRTTARNSAPASGAPRSASRPPARTWSSASASRTARGRSSTIWSLGPASPARRFPGEARMPLRGPGSPDAKMRILFLTHYFHPEGNAPATRVYEMTRRWVKQGFEVERGDGRAERAERRRLPGLPQPLALARADRGRRDAARLDLPGAQQGDRAAHPQLPVLLRHRHAGRALDARARTW